MSISAKELGRLIELRKARTELEFQKSVLSMDCTDELDSVQSSISQLEGKIRSAGVELAIPFSDRIGEISGKLEAFSSEQITDALKQRSGECYELLKERGDISRRNNENRLEIGKLSLLIGKLPGDAKEQVSLAVRSGAAEGPLPLDSMDAESRERLMRFMRRCGITAEPPEQGEKEVRIELRSRSVWVSESVKEKLEGNMRKMEQITPSIHLKNAQRHVKVFSDEEEQEFASLQREYLELLKEQDALLKEFYDEEKSV